MTTLLRLPEVARRTGYSEGEITRRAKLGTFPAPVTIGERAVAWVDAEVEQHIQALIAERDKAKA